MYYITPDRSGELLEWSAEEGRLCCERSDIGRQDVLPYITSPIAGMVVKNNVLAGQIVGPTTQLAVVADTETCISGLISKKPRS